MYRALVVEGRNSAENPWKQPKNAQISTVQNFNNFNINI